ncbi:MAG: hypothetical protein GY833_23950 [Aestuariibacter sp.]|nr:hypothetical protein [Aestuariibacter sp.]
MGVFGKAIFATAPKIAGVQLHQFSAYHALALMELDSPYITGNRDPEIGDTTMAIELCATQRADGLESAFGYSRFRWFVYWMFHDHAKIANALSEYITSSAEYPAIWRNKEADSGSSTGAAWPFYIVSVVSQELNGIDYEKIWDKPLAELICHKAIIGERNNDFEIAEKEIENIEARREATEDKNGND